MIMNAAPAVSSLAGVSFPSLCSELRSHITGGIPGTAEGLERYSTTLTTLSERIKHFADPSPNLREGQIPDQQQIMTQVEALRASLVRLTESRQTSFPEEAFTAIVSTINAPAVPRCPDRLSPDGNAPVPEQRTLLVDSLSRARTAVNALLAQEVLASGGEGASLKQLYQGKGEARQMRSLLNAATTALGGVLTQLSNLEK